MENKPELSFPEASSRYDPLKIRVTDYTYFFALGHLAQTRRTFAEKQEAANLGQI